MRSLLIPVMDAGSGHRRPAEAIAEAVRRRHPDRFTVEVIDPGPELAPLTDRFLKRSWDFALAHPWLARHGYCLVQAPWARYYLPTLFRQLQEQGVDFIRRRRPDIIFSTHFFWLTIAALARQRHRLDCPVFGYVIDPHRLWAEPRADGIAFDPLVMPDPERQLRGVSQDKIRAMPFPVAAEFTMPAGNDSPKAMERLRLEPQNLTVLVSQGGQGIGRSAHFVRAVLERNLPVNLVIACGRNTGLKKYLDQLAVTVKPPTRLITFGYTTAMVELMAMADIVVGKGGPSTTFEALSLGKPMIYTNWATYTELPLVFGMIERNCAWFTPNAKDFGDLLAGICAKPELLAEKHQACRQLGFHSGADAVADWLAASID
mgnify:CR=1 FL=1